LLDGHAKAAERGVLTRFLLRPRLTVRHAFLARTVSRRRVNPHLRSNHNWLRRLGHGKMRGMPDPYFPPCCSLPSHDWLLPRALPQAHLSSSQFDPQRWTAEDFTLSGIPPARGLAKRQSEFLAGRLCAREALACLTQQRSIPAVGEDGAPQWPAGVVGSITHGAGLALAVVG